MRYLYLIFLAFIVCSLTAVAQIPKPVEHALTAENVAEGTEFFVAIPPNELNPFPTNTLAIYICSAFDTKVEVEDYSTGQIASYQVAKNVVRKLTDANGGTSWNWELRESEQVLLNGIGIRSAKPISVYVLNSKQTSSDGYMAIPTSAWGKEYIHVGYYDFRETRPWAGGFVVVAKEDNTMLSIDLKGVGTSLAKTADGRTINTGVPISVTLNTGEVYLVKGDGATRGVFDLTGTKITATRPIGVISFHERTTMPNMLVNGNGRNHLVEMLTPISAWGKTFTSLELPRESVNGQGKGDVFRVVAGDSNTNWTLKYYDEVTGQLLGQSGGTLVIAGDFADIGNVSSPSQITNGFAVWETTKPVCIMQYSCSSSFDGDPNLDPFMISVQPLESYTKDLTFCVASESAFNHHRVSIVVSVLPGVQDTIAALNSIQLDGVPLATHKNAFAPKLLKTKMPNGMYWARIGISGAEVGHAITSNDSVVVGGYVFGYGAFDAYGWSIGGKSTPPVTVDTLAPLIVRTKGECGTWSMEATELRNIPDPPLAITADTNQVETGIAKIDTVSGSSTDNYILELITSQTFPENPVYTRFQYRWTVVDNLKDARAEYFVEDFAGNRVLDTLVYDAPVFVDTMPPITTLISEDSVQWKFEATELRNVPTLPVACPVSGQQRESGLTLMQLDAASTNLTLAVTSGTQFPPDSIIKRAEFVVRVIDPTIAAFGIVTSADKSGNVTYDTIRYQSPTSVDGESSSGVFMTIVPNPVIDDCRVTWSNQLHATVVEVIDLHGRIVLKQQVIDGGTEAMIDVSPLPKGAYTALVRGSGATATQRFIVR